MWSHDVRKHEHRCFIDSCDLIEYISDPLPVSGVLNIQTEKLELIRQWGQIQQFISEFIEKERILKVYIGFFDLRV